MAAHVARPLALGHRTFLELAVEVACHLVHAIEAALEAAFARLRERRREAGGRDGQCRERREQPACEPAAFDQDDERREQCEHDPSLGARRVQNPSLAGGDHFSSLTRTPGCNVRAVIQFTRGVGAERP